MSTVDEAIRKVLEVAKRWRAYESQYYAIDDELDDALAELGRISPQLMPVEDPSFTIRVNGREVRVPGPGTSDYHDIVALAGNADWHGRTDLTVSWKRILEDHLQVEGGRMIGGGIIELKPGMVFVVSDTTNNS